VFPNLTLQPLDSSLAPVPEVPRIVEIRTSLRRGPNALQTICTVGFVFLTLSLFHAQEAIKAEPTHYKLAFENEYVQVVNVPLWAPREIRHARTYGGRGP